MATDGGGLLCNLPARLPTQITGLSPSDLGLLFFFFYFTGINQDASTAEVWTLALNTKTNRAFLNLQW